MLRLISGIVRAAWGLWWVGAVKDSVWASTSADGGAILLAFLGMLRLEYEKYLIFSEMRTSQEGGEGILSDAVYVVLLGFNIRH
jgi:hypothetical protein